MSRLLLILVLSKMMLANYVTTFPPALSVSKPDENDSFIWSAKDAITLVNSSRSSLVTSDCGSSPRAVAWCVGDKIRGPGACAGGEFPTANEIPPAIEFGWTNLLTSLNEYSLGASGFCTFDPDTSVGSALCGPDSPSETDVFATEESSALATRCLFGGRPRFRFGV